MMKLCTCVLEVRRNAEFEDVTYMTFDTVELGVAHNAHVQKVHATVHSVHGTSFHTIHNTISIHKVLIKASVYNTHAIYMLGSGPENAH